MGCCDGNELRFVIRCSGSVIPKGLIWAVPCATLAAVFHNVLGRLEIQEVVIAQEAQFWSNFTYILGILLVFRTNQAYSRYWEGATLLQQVRGEWFQATSSIFAFCSSSPNQRDQVEAFQHLLVRLMSMLYCTALQKIALIPSQKFETITAAGIDQESLLFLAHSDEQCEVLVQWIQRLIIDNHNLGIINAPAPILSRVFQELSRGFVNAENVRKIAEVPFPFPYTQMIIVLLLAATILTPFLAGVTAHSDWEAALITFMPILTFWCLNYMASEIEQPFGEDANDLPIPEMVRSMNVSLKNLIQRRTQNPPSFSYDKRSHSHCTTSPPTFEGLTGEGAEGVDAPDFLNPPPRTLDAFFGADFSKRRTPSKRPNPDLGRPQRSPPIRSAGRSSTAPPSPTTSLHALNLTHGSVVPYQSEGSEQDAVSHNCWLSSTGGSHERPPGRGLNGLPESLAGVLPSEANGVKQAGLGQAPDANAACKALPSRARPPPVDAVREQAPGWQSCLAEEEDEYDSSSPPEQVNDPEAVIPCLGATKQIGYLRLGSALASRNPASAAADAAARQQAAGPRPGTSLTSRQASVAEAGGRQQGGERRPGAAPPVAQRPVATSIEPGDPRTVRGPQGSRC
mmetsp:Transcript_61174/g.137848  ORF Transcript_61174/g.137848 Transcript_61174/m.137848 type:complete len:625 (-) Transcript_61174:21-1895(-)